MSPCPLLLGPLLARGPSIGSQLQGTSELLAGGSTLQSVGLCREPVRTCLTTASSVYSQTLLSAEHIVIATGGRPKYPTHVSVPRTQSCLAPRACSRPPSSHFPH